MTCPLIIHTYLLSNKKKLISRKNSFYENSLLFPYINSKDYKKFLQQKNIDERLISENINKFSFEEVSEFCKRDISCGFIEKNLTKIPIEKITINLDHLNKDKHSYPNLNFLVIPKKIPIEYYRYIFNNMKLNNLDFSLEIVSFFKEYISLYNKKRIKRLLTSEEIHSHDIMIISYYYNKYKEKTPVFKKEKSLSRIVKRLIAHFKNLKFNLPSSDLNNLKINQFTLKNPRDCKELSKWGDKLNNCLEVCVGRSFNENLLGIFYEKEIIGVLSINNNEIDIETKSLFDVHQKEIASFVNNLLSSSKV